MNINSSENKFFYCISCNLYIQKPIYLTKTRCPICGNIIKYNIIKEDVFDNFYDLKFSGEEE